MADQPVRYELWVRSPEGDRVGLIDRWSRLRYVPSLDNSGHFELDLLRFQDLYADGIKVDLWRVFSEPDYGIEIWRGREELRLEADTIWFIRHMAIELDTVGRETLRLIGVSARDILRRRIAAYPADTFETNKAGMTASTMMYQVVRENMIGLSSGSANTFDPERDLSRWMSLSQPLVVSAPAIAKAFARRNVLAVLDDLMHVSLSTSFPTFFDVVWTGQDFQFQTYVPNRGVNRTDGSSQADMLVFSPQLGNLVAPRIDHDHTAEVTVVYAGGRGEGVERIVAMARDEARERRSPFGRIEQWQDATQYTTLSGLQGEAQAQVNAGRPRDIFSGEIIDSPQARYGQDWNWGDRVVVEAFDERRDVWIWSVSVGVDPSGEETIVSRLRESGRPDH